MPMRKRAPLPEVSPVVQSWLPEASNEELKEASNNLRRFLAVAYRIYLRIEADKSTANDRDNLAISDTVDPSNTKDS